MRTFLRAVSHAQRAFLARTCFRAASFLPVGALRVLARAVARVAIRVPGRARDATLVNLELCFPELSATERVLLARASLAESVAAILELGPLWSWKRERVLALVREVDGLPLLRAAIDSGRGVVLVGPHLGAWELTGLYVSAMAPITSLYRPLRVRRLDEHVRDARKRFGAQLVPASSSGVRELYRALFRGEVVGVLPDQDPGDGGGRFVPFFGIPANTSTLVARLLECTQAVPLLAWTERLSSGHFRLHFEEPRAGLAGLDAERATRNLNAEVERLVRGRPEQYLWTYRRFRRRPFGQPNPYRRADAPSRAALLSEMPVAAEPGKALV